MINTVKLCLFFHATSTEFAPTQYCTVAISATKNETSMATMVESRVVAASLPAQSTVTTHKPIDRTLVCPFLLRLFVSRDNFTPLHQFTPTSQPSSELRVYTWRDATLAELRSLIAQIHPDAQKRVASLAFRLVFVDHQHLRNTGQAKFTAKEMGIINNWQDESTNLDQKKTLDQCQFVIGDYVDVSIRLKPGTSTSSAYRDSGRWSRGAGGDRDSRRVSHGREDRVGRRGNDHYAPRPRSPSHHRP